jgi:hypothetical protein
MSGPYRVVHANGEGTAGGDLAEALSTQLSELNQLATRLHGLINGAAKSGIPSDHIQAGVRLLDEKIAQPQVEALKVLLAAAAEVSP